MKRFFILILLCLMFSVCTSCTDKNTNTNENLNINIESIDFAEYYDDEEYSRYVNFFYLRQIDTYLNQDFEVNGIYFVLDDADSGIKRSYVWGYANNDRERDYLWEFLPQDETNTPTSGTFITVKGKLKESEQSFAGYWLEDASLLFDKQYEQIGVDIDLTVAGPTLSGMQMLEIQTFPDEYIGASIAVFGKISTPGTIQHPFDEEYWEMPFVADDTGVAGDLCIIAGIVKETSDDKAYIAAVLTIKTEEETL